MGGHSHGELALSLERERGARFLLLVLAVQLHSFFEGIALGLQTQQDKVGPGRAGKGAGLSSRAPVVAGSKPSDSKGATQPSIPSGK